MAPRDPWTLPVVIFPVFGCNIGIYTVGNWQNAYIGSGTHGVRAIMIGRAKWKLLKLPLPIKVAN